jgi:hypothetical protein
MPQGAIHTIPVKLDDCNIPDQFRFLHWCDLVKESGFEQIVQAIRVGLSQSQQSAPVERKGTSVAFSQIRCHINVLSYIGGSITPDEQACLRACFVSILEGKFPIFPHPSRKGFFLPVVHCNHTIILAERPGDELVIVDIHRDT